jgi:hypothetical protein
MTTTCSPRHGRRSLPIDMCRAHGPNPRAPRTRGEPEAHGLPKCRRPRSRISEAWHGDGRSASGGGKSWPLDRIRQLISLIAAVPVGAPPRQSRARSCHQSLYMRFPCNADRDRLSSTERRYATDRHVVSACNPKARSDRHRIDRRPRHEHHERSRIHHRVA